MRATAPRAASTRRWRRSSGSSPARMPGEARRGHPLCRGRMLARRHPRGRHGEGRLLHRAWRRSASLGRGLRRRFRKARLVGGDAGFEEIVAAAVSLVEDPSRGLGLPLHVRGTAFQLKVWEALRGIGPGRTATYKEIAAKAGMPGAVRAVGTRDWQQQDRGGDPRVTGFSAPGARCRATAGAWTERRRSWRANVRGEAECQVLGGVMFRCMLIW